MMIAGVVGLFFLGYAILNIISAKGLNWFNLLLLIPSITLPIFIAIWSTKKLSIARELDRDGVSTKGKITGKWLRNDSDSEGRSGYVAYQFSGGYKAEQRVGYLDYRQLQPGDRVTVHYLPRDPNYSRMEV
jgi:hypothetical protein